MIQAYWCVGDLTFASIKVSCNCFRHLNFRMFKMQLACCNLHVAAVALWPGCSVLTTKSFLPEMQTTVWQPNQAMELLGWSFNQDYGCFACGTTSGFRIFNSEPFQETVRLRTSYVLLKVLYVLNTRQQQVSLVSITSGIRCSFRGTLRDEALASLRCYSDVIFWHWLEGEIILAFQRAR